MDAATWELILNAVKVLVLAVAVISVVPIMTWVERRGSAIIQLRLGPNRVGPFGLFQPLADGLKFLFKEDIVPPFAYKPFYVAAPAVALASALFAFAVIPFAGTFTGVPVPFTDHSVDLPMVILDVEVGVLFLLAASSMGVFGIILAGWSSNNKYSQMGGLRSSAQMISYELTLGMSVAAVLIMAGSLRPVEIVAQQSGWFWNWNVFNFVESPFIPVGILAFFLLLISSYAETNRLPFDLPEAESELVGGYHVEYSAMKFSMFFMAEYINMITGAALVVTLFVGGYELGFPPELLGLEGNWLVFAQLIAFSAKMAVFMWLYVHVRWTLPRFRYDQLMDLGWKVLIPLALVTVFLAMLRVLLSGGAQ